MPRPVWGLAPKSCAAKFRPALAHTYTQAQWRRPFAQSAGQPLRRPREREGVSPKRFLHTTIDDAIEAGPSKYGHHRLGAPIAAGTLVVGLRRNRAGDNASYVCRLARLLRLGVLGQTGERVARPLSAKAITDKVQESNALAYYSMRVFLFNECFSAASCYKLSGDNSIVVQR